MLQIPQGDWRLQPVMAGYPCPVMETNKVLFWRTIAGTEGSAGTKAMPWQAGSCSPGMLLTITQ